MRRKIMSEKILRRQGDLLIQQHDAVPDHAKKIKAVTLVEGESGGHSHRLAERRTARVYRSGDVDEQQVGTLYLDVFAERAEIIHPEHGTIELPAGIYRVWRQREFVQDDIRASGTTRVVMD